MIICGDSIKLLSTLQEKCVDLLFADPPYNLNKKFKNVEFKSIPDYEKYLDSWISQLPRLMKPNGSLYFCCDWRCSNEMYNVISKYFKVRNRITWEREKGRGALKNWKNCSEDIYFCTMSNEYTFNVEDVKLKKRVVAPYKVDGQPKGWKDGYRLTYPSNLWTDITVPFWSMKENTDHPTQKSEKLLAKIILASSNVGDLVFDPFLGSGTTSVVAKKLDRKCLGIEIDPYYCKIAEERLKSNDKRIQGYDGVFYERNSK